jgi:predicted alpha/beta superfamily hydrolase
MTTNADGQSSISLRVVALPSTTPDGAELYVAGDFNGWDPRDPATRLVPHDDGTLAVRIGARLGDTLQLKLTRGSWDSVETQLDGEELPNRQCTVRADGQQLEVEVASWRDHHNLLSRPHRLSGSVEVIGGFHIPQLGRSRRIWVYLPPGYETSTQRYPVLYMHDGQNLFDPAASFSGAWHVGEALEAVFGDDPASATIVVAPDNGGPQRLDEYGPWPDDETGAGGDGPRYAEFLIATLKPHIDATFRTRPERRYTGIAGSSMGGLISLYAGLKHPEVFARIGAFSSSIWFAGRKLLDEVRAWGSQARFQRAGGMRVYLDVGGLEGRSAEGEKAMVEDTVEMFYLLKELGLDDDDLHLVFDDHARHAEPDWARRFGAAFQWLYAR